MLFCSYQLVQPAHHSVLGRSKTLYDIKDAFDKAMKGDAFAVSVHDCTQSFIAELGKGCAGISKALYFLHV